MAKDNDEADTLYARQQRSLPLSGGRYAALDNPHIIDGRTPYPKVAPTPLTEQQPDHAFDPSRDRVDEPTAMTFGVDLTKLPGSSPPPDASLVSSPEAPPDSPAADPSAGLSGFSKHPNIMRAGNHFMAYAGRGLHREKLGTFETF